MRRLAALLLALVFLLGGCTFSGTGAAGGDILTIHFIDVGQADCTLLICGETTILIDAGNTDDGHMVCSYLDSLGVDEIDLAIATHAHEDHLGGYASVFYDFEVKQVWASPQEYPSSYAYKNFINGVANQGLTLLTPDPGHTYSSDGIQITVLGPVKDYYDDINDSSLVLSIKFGQKRFLFTGDMERLAEEELLESGAYLKADVLHVGHHGSYSSTSYPFLRAVAPQYAVIPVGRNNEYGHPHDAPMSRLRDAEVTVFRTDLMGTIILSCDGKTIGFMWERSAVQPGIPDV